MIFCKRNLLGDLWPGEAHLVPFALDVPPPELAAVPLTLPSLPQLPRPPAEIALSIAPSADLLIEDANTANIDQAVALCRANGSVPASPTKLASPLTLLARVEKDGRVSDSKIEIGSGSRRWDEAASHCLLDHGSLMPRRVNGALLVSWQRVHWPKSLN